jgi:hypothetical protein
MQKIFQEQASSVAQRAAKLTELQRRVAHQRVA